MMSRARRLSLLALLSLAIAARALAQADDAATPETTKYPVFHLGGFADLELHSRPEEGQQQLDRAEIDLYPTLQLSDRWSTLAEVVARRDLHRGAAAKDEKVVVELELERFYVAYEPTDLIRIEAGETHTGIIQWNDREHRSRMLQTPIDVPAIARTPQDDGAWPLRFIGVMVSGRVEGPLGLRYGVALGNGSGTSRDSIPVFGRNRSAAGLFSISIEPARWRGLELGVAAYAQHLPGTDPLRERDFTFSASYVNRGAEVRAEWARMIHTSIRTDQRFQSSGYYVLLSHRLNGRLSPLRPYLLLDHLTLAPEEYLRESTDENAWAVGVRWDVTSRFTVKSEFRSQRAPSGEREGVVGVQFGLSF